MYKDATLLSLTGYTIQVSNCICILAIQQKQNQTCKTIDQENLLSSR